MGQIYWNNFSNKGELLNTMKKLIFWGTIFALFVLGGGGAGAYISHTNAVQHENTTNTSGSSKGQNPKSGPADNNGKNNNKEDNSSSDSNASKSSDSSNSSSSSSDKKQDKDKNSSAHLFTITNRPYET